MTAEVEHLLDVLLELSSEDRAEVAVVLIDSLQQIPSEEIEAAWIVEAKRRLESIRRGESTPATTEVVEQELDEIVAMASKTPRELLRESLERNARELENWPAWMRSAISTANIFSVSPPDEEPRSDEGHEVPMSRPVSDG